MHTQSKSVERQDEENEDSKPPTDYKLTDQETRDVLNANKYQPYNEAYEDDQLNFGAIADSS